MLAFEFFVLCVKLLYLTLSLWVQRLLAMQLGTENFVLVHFLIRLENLFNSAGGLVQAVKYEFSIDKPRVQVSFPNLRDFDKQLLDLDFAVNLDVDSHGLVIGQVVVTFRELPSLLLI